MMHSAARLDETDRGVYAQLSNNDMEQNLIGPGPDNALPMTSATVSENIDGINLDMI